MTRTDVRNIMVVLNEGGAKMKEMLKSKVMVLFIVMVLGVTYTSSLQTQKLEEENLKEYRDLIVMNQR